MRRPWRGTRPCLCRAGGIKPPAAASWSALDIKQQGGRDDEGTHTALESSSNFTVKNPARAINDRQKGFGLRLVDSGLKRQFGARTAPRDGEIEIEINPNIVGRVGIPVENRQAGATGFSVLPLDEVLMHEVGHFFATSGILSNAVLAGTARSNAMSLDYENRHRHQKGRIRGNLKRTSHRGAVLLD